VTRGIDKVWNPHGVDYCVEVILLGKIYLSTYKLTCVIYFL